MDRSDTAPDVTVIKVVGVGGGACAALDRMIAAGLREVEYVAVDTDRRTLQRSRASVKVQLGMDPATRHGTNGDDAAALRAAQTSMADLEGSLRDTDLTIIVATLGGGTGTGAAPVVAEVARRSAALTVGAITTPSTLEPGRHRVVAARGADRLGAAVDALLSIPGDTLKKMVTPTTWAVFAAADDWLGAAVHGLCDGLTTPGPYRLSFPELRHLLASSGAARVAMGQASGFERGSRAVDRALACPLIDVPLSAVPRVLITLSVRTFDSADLGEVLARLAANRLSAGLRFAVALDETAVEELRVTLVFRTNRMRRGVQRTRLILRHRRVARRQPNSASLVVHPRVRTAARLRPSRPIRSCLTSMWWAMLPSRGRRRTSRARVAKARHRHRSTAPPWLGSRASSTHAMGAYRLSLLRLRARGDWRALQGTAPRA